MVEMRCGTKAQQRRYQRMMWNDCRLWPAGCRANECAARRAAMLHAATSASAISGRSTPPRGAPCRMRRRTCCNDATSSATQRARHAAAAAVIGRPRRKIDVKPSVADANVPRRGVSLGRRAASHCDQHPRRWASHRSPFASKIDPIRGKQQCTSRHTEHTDT